MFPVGLRLSLQKEDPLGLLLV
jgi:hypothetical protein